MPLFTYQCDSCGYTEDHISSIEDRNNPVLCNKCGGESKRILTFNATDCINEYAPWLTGENGTTSVVDKDGDVFCQRFLKDPTRTNFEIWKKTQGLRPLERGEKRQKKEFDVQKHAERIMQEKIKNESYTVKGV